LRLPSRLFQMNFRLAVNIEKPLEHGHIANVPQFDQDSEKENNSLVQSYRDRLIPLSSVLEQNSNLESNRVNGTLLPYNPKWPVDLIAPFTTPLPSSVKPAEENYRPESCQ
jgi:hypothetical protein